MGSGSSQTANCMYRSRSDRHASDASSQPARVRARQTRKLKLLNYQSWSLFVFRSTIVPPPPQPHWSVFNRPDLIDPIAFVVFIPSLLSHIPSRMSSSNAGPSKPRATVQDVSVKKLVPCQLPKKTPHAPISTVVDCPPGVTHHRAYDSAQISYV